MIRIIKNQKERDIFTAMLRLITAVVFCLAFLVQTFSGQFMQLSYILNTRAYAKSCENKARPAMHCNGKCQLMKKMQQEEKKDQQTPERKSENKNEVLSSRSFFCSLELYSSGIRNTYFIIGTAIPIDRSFPVFHPPQV